MSNQPVYETLRNYFKDSKKKPSSPLKFHYFFGLSDIGKISAFMKSLKLQNNTNNESVLNATNNEAKNIVQEPVIEAEVVSKGGSKNKTDNTRWALLFTYARWFYKPAFDFNLNTTKNIIRVK